MGCKVGALPTYLGLPLCLGNAPKFIWNPMLERIEKKFATWKANCLSLRERITLIKSALSNLPIYMLLYKFHASVVNHIKKLRREFLWQTKEDKKFHSVHCKSVCKPMKRGLKFRPLNQMNKVHMGKWLWRMGEEQEESLWSQVISNNTEY